MLVRELEDKLREREAELRLLRDSLDENEVTICQVCPWCPHVLSLSPSLEHLVWTYPLIGGTNLLWAPFTDPCRGIPFPVDLGMWVFPTSWVVLCSPWGTLVWPMGPVAQTGVPYLGVPFFE